MTTPGKDFFRVDRSKPTLRILFGGAALVATGAGMIGTHLMHRLPDRTGHWMTVAGGALLLLGLVLGFGTLAAMLFENVYVALEDERVLLHENGREASIPWDDVGVAAAANGIVTVNRKEEGEPLVFHAGRAAADIAGKIEEKRRKATFFVRAS